MKIGIVGMGVVGLAISKLFKNFEIKKYDLYNSKYKDNVKECDIIFVCVPTECKNKKELDTSIVESVVEEFNPRLFIIPSTMQPGTSDRLVFKYHKRIVVQPEYLGETVDHPMNNLNTQKFLILGGDKEDVDLALDLYKQVYNSSVRIRVVSRIEAEVIKLSENRAIAFKVAQCQELYDICVHHNIDYNTIREAVYGDDPRFNLLWTFIFKDNRGFNSKCIPKDVYAWKAWAECEEHKVKANLTSSLLKYNESLIR